MTERDELDNGEMLTRDEYFRQISKRGDKYGNKGGLLDLLTWCGKIALNRVSVGEAAYFARYPNAPYSDYLASRGAAINTLED